MSSVPPVWERSAQAELHTFGMVGVGRIFEGYRDGQLDADDEVAVIHSSSEQGYRVCSDALVNIREGLNRLSPLASCPRLRRSVY